MDTVSWSGTLEESTPATSKTISDTDKARWSGATAPCTKEDGQMVIKMDLVSNHMRNSEIRLVYSKIILL